MQSATRSEVIAKLRQFVHGEISPQDLHRYVRGQSCRWLDDLLEEIQLTPDDYSQIALDEVALGVPVATYINGDCQLAQLHEWALEAYRIFGTSAYAASHSYNPEVEASLTLLSLICGIEYSETEEIARSCILRIHDALENLRPIPARSILRQLLMKKSRVDLLTRELGDDFNEPWRERQWAEIGLAPSGYSGVREPVSEDCWFLPLGVCTADAWNIGGPTDAWTHIENNQIFQLKETYPNFDFEINSPSVFIDPDGLTEVILDVPCLGAAELRHAVQLFAMVHRIRCCTLDRVLAIPSQEDQ